ncbi:MAG: DUF3576 domain-containing protein [Magnetococcales bacterium]|nr:DUF3576 domain-containing protein [Magnetococcales bacterium]
MNGKILTTVLLGLALATSGCSSKIWSSPNKVDEHKLSQFGKKNVLDEARETGDYNSAADAGEDSFFSFGAGNSSGSSGIFGGGGSYVSSQEEVRAEKLYQGALDVVMDLPIQVASRSGGFISTDWKVNPRDANSRYRLNIRVSGVEPYGEVRVVVLKQELMGGEWTDRPADKNLSRQIEKAVRKKAEVIRF